ncbi:2-octaprenyl-6-methoxyphenyl hydroxylase [Sansalvadorimonas verongulae]|uniref:2-octaprenyl-6-methoxyphenyl hydroxylase n=1 Tax=Sansalvadorimonas verongulae TaxID=2172824 RepID=UPI0012BC0692|nr:2-octaprenyl-6-methoxyphenyl hydroxylase [Sansalvadorimonas verongulae]MTI13301.1 2-octaprenyl-6-methoxyphenyl hydroxylase [Sansalvadorimonas verongulae]
MQTSHVDRNHVDVVIIGGGMVGASLAIGLRNTLPESISIAVIEAVALSDDAPAGWQPSYDARSTALSEGTRRIFEALGVWQHIDQNAEPITDIHVSDRGHTGITRIKAEEHRVPALGYVVDNSWLGQILVSAVQERDGIDWLCPVSVKELTPEESGMIVALDTGKSLKAELVILADGGRSGLTRTLGIDIDESQYGQTAIVTNITPARHHQSVAYERFTDEGPMALLPRHNGDCALVWTMPEALAEERLQLVEDDFLAELQDRFGYRLGRFCKVGERFSYPLSLKQSREQVRTGLVVLGNAAHSLHPVAGQGFNLSLRDTQALADVLGAAGQQGQPLGGLDLLLSYVKGRQQDQHQTIGFSDKVVSLFSNDSLVLAGARNAGLLGMGLLFPVRDWFARQAMGLNR